MFLVIIGCIVFFLDSTAGAQMNMLSNMKQDLEKEKDESGKHYEEIFPKDEFLKVDANQNGYLEKEEIVGDNENLESFLKDEVFQEADRDNDGRLSIHEIRTYKHIEKEHPNAMSTKLISELKKKYPSLTQRELKYFFKHKEKGEKLLRELQPGQPETEKILDKVRDKIREEDEKIMDKQEEQNKRLGIQKEIIQGRMTRPQDTLKKAQEKYDAVSKATKAWKNE